MPVKHCCYGDCNSDSRYVGRRHEMENVFFIPFPKPKSQREKCEKWVRLCGRKNFTIDNINKDTYMCSKHFVGGSGPTEDFPDPLPAQATKFEKIVLLSKRKRKSPAKRSQGQNRSQRKKLVFQLENEVENNIVNQPVTESVSAILSDHSYALKENSNHSYTLTDNLPKHNEPGQPEGDEEVYACVDVHPITDLKEEVVVTEPMTEPTKSLSEPTRTLCTQTNLYLNNMKYFTDAEMRDQIKLQRNLFTKHALKDDESCKFYTGLSLANFTMVFKLLQKKGVKKMNYWKGQNATGTKPNQNSKSRRCKKLTIKEELVLTLIRLRRGIDIEVLSDIFGIDSTNTSRIFITWINFLYLEFNYLISWPSREEVRKSLPRQFKYFPKTRVIIDCIEFYIQKPSLPSSQRVTQSKYKHHNTFKALVGMSPSGAFTFLSNLFTRTISDRRIVEESGFLYNLEYGDEVMANKGFLIRDLITRHYATLNIPPCAMGRRMSSQAITKTRRIASARLHVERALGHLKSFKLLQGIIPLELHSMLDQIVVVCAALCNLDSKLLELFS